ncbi:MAG TPA: shikimate kinase [Cyclobacteriaceae bacterium]|nr:shikimate kinase [Cyclobacteriaceae bacterium]
MKIFLIGLPGSGKSTVGKQLALTMKLPFVDLDDEIERSEGMSIPTLFKQKKEDYFRRAESALLTQWCGREDDFVMATGGGAPVFFDNMARMNAVGITVFLDVPAAEIARRVAASGRNDRPLLQKADAEAMKDQVEFMRSQRIRHYQQATHIIKGTAIPASEIAEVLRTGTQR